MTFEKYKWSQLNSLQIGRYAEYYTKMEFTLHGFDVFEPEVDHRGVDFVVRKGSNRYFDVQVKSSRGLHYLYARKVTLTPRRGLWIALPIFFNGRLPELYLFPSTVWFRPSPPFVSHDYKGLKSKPEWGISLTKRSRALLEKYRFDRSIRKLEGKQAHGKRRRGSFKERKARALRRQVRRSTGQTVFSAD